MTYSIQYIFHAKKHPYRKLRYRIYENIPSNFGNDFHYLANIYFQLPAWGVGNQGYTVGLHVKNILVPDLHYRPNAYSNVYTPYTTDVYTI